MSYILPTRFGWIYFGLLIVMVLSAATYNNNLAYILVFVCFGAAMVSMVLTYQHLGQVKMRFLRANDGFAGEPLRLHYEIENRSERALYGIQVQLQKSDQDAYVEIIGPKQVKTVEVSLIFPQRGMYLVPKTWVSTVYPLGLFRAWRSLNTLESVYVYPKPEGESLRDEYIGLQEGAERISQSQSNEKVDFFEHKPFQTGESKHHINWKLFARFGILVTKSFVGEESSILKIQLDENLRQVEKSLSQLSKWIVEAKGKNQAFELHIGQHVIVALESRTAREALRALARYPRVHQHVQDFS